MWSATGHRGVVFIKARPGHGNYDHYRAQINANGRKKWLGKRKTAAEAAVLYDQAARRYFGDEAWLTTPITRWRSWPDSPARDDASLRTSVRLLGGGLCRKRKCPAVPADISP